MHKTTIPIFIFILAITIVFGNFGVRIWNIDVQKDIDSEMATLNEIQSRNERRLLELNKNSSPPIVTMEVRKTGLFPKTVCSNTSLVPICSIKWSVMETKVPVIKGTKIDPNVKNEVEVVKKEQLAITENIKHLSEKKRKIEKISYLDKESFRGFFSLLIVLSSLYIILSKSYKAESEKWAFGAIGTIIGYWFWLG